MELENVEDIYPLSPLQQLMLLHYLGSSDSEKQIESMEFTLTGKIDINEIQSAWNTVVSQHAALRTEFHWKKLSKPVQVVRLNLEGIPSASKCVPGKDIPDQVREFRERNLACGVQLDNAPIVRLFMIRTSEESVHVLITYHPIVLDGWSIAIVLRDFFTILRGGESDGDVGKGRFRNYIAWLQNRNSAETEQWWRKQLCGIEQVTPVWTSKKVDHSLVGKDYIRIKRNLGESQSNELTRLARINRTTLNMAVQTTWALLLGHYAGCEQVVIGTVTSGRPSDLDHVESMVGTFINNLPLSVSWSSRSRVKEILREVQTTILELQRHGYVSPAEIQAWSDVGDAGRLFESLVLFQNFPVAGTFWDDSGRFEVGGLQKNIRTSFPLSLVCIPQKSIELELILDSALWDEPAAQRILDDFLRLLTACLSNPEWPIMQALELVSPPSDGDFFVSALERGQHDGKEPDPDLVEPANELERAVADIWKDILGISRLGVYDDFFELGGDSLKALRMISRIRQKLGIEIQVHDIFKAPNISKLSDSLRADMSDGKDTFASKEEELRARIDKMTPEQISELLEKKRRGKHR